MKPDAHTSLRRDGRPRRRRPARWLAFALAAIFVLPLCTALASHFVSGAQAVDWRSARRDSSGLAPDPRTTDDAVIQVYAARAVGWRGALGVHTWFAVKPGGTAHYTRLEVTGFSVRRGGTAVRVGQGVPDAYWYGSAPTLLRELRGGEDVDALIERLFALASRYPHDDSYRLWPGPNSNTFVAHLARNLPELSLDLPPTAIGKDYLVEGGLFGGLFGRPPSGRGVQVSLAGLAGVVVSPQEGLELNLLGLSAGIDLMPPALKLPGIGRVGFAEPPAP